ncbi:PTS sugar transporter subunit IIA [Thermosulfurimonas marina]|uniref:PTS sugar transporter subunit IIA n=1 Tax=Thermosulfurimonas marina TaxID=2047767 RepID=A0A6H1WUW0_9BACT|nr:PTS sugar transporter subunit IIA [Thermosulfurimonas marina]QJA06939.1 PTS sugar transporter subunit IIA [Thermosulfurimonas marina]
MRLLPLLAEKALFEDLQVPDKWAFFREVSRALAEETGFAAERIEAVLVERERLGSTALGEGVALPHARLPLLPRIFVSVARSRQGVPFESPNGRPVHLIFTILAPEEAQALYLHCLSRVASLLREPGVRKALMEAPGREELKAVLREFDREF